jgi:hypothetical protein
MVWRDLGTVTSKGAGNYSFIDSQPWDGNNYYRLKMIDLDAIITGCRGFLKK